MSWLDGLRHRVRTVLDPGSYERELEEEMRLHEELDAAQQRDPYRARRRFGNRTYYKEETRRMTWLGSLDVLRQDLSYAWRSISRTPTFTLTVVLTLALGIGLNAATFTILDKIYLRPPSGVRDPSSVRRVWIERPSASGKAFTSIAMSYPYYRAIATMAEPGGLALVTIHTDVALGRRRSGPKVNVAYATWNYFPVLGVHAAYGRLYGASEDRIRNGAPVAVISDRLWREQLGADSALSSKTIQIGPNVYDVIGVLPPEFTGIELRQSDVWIPLASQPLESWMREPWWEIAGYHIYFAVQRLPRGANERALEQRATQLLRQNHRDDPARMGRDTLETVQLGSIIEARGPGEGRQEYTISTRLAGVAAIVLMIACANVLNLLLARAVRRRREIAVRLALGISRWRLMRLLTTETLVLALLAGVAAVLAAWWGGGFLRSLLMPDIEWREPALHWRVIVFTAVVAVGCGLLAGIVPAVQATRPQLTSALNEGSPAGRGLTHRSYLRGALVVTQAALSVMLLVGAALFVRSLHNVRGVDTGYDVDRLLFGMVDFDADAEPPVATVAADMSAIAERLRARPGVEDVARATMAPMWGFSVTKFYFDNDSSTSLVGKMPTFTGITSSFFTTVGMRLLRGSVFDDRPGAPAHVMVNEEMARLLWGERDAIGQCIRFEKRDNPCYIVVGVVETTHNFGVVEKNPNPQFFVPLGNMPRKRAWDQGTTLIVRTRADAAPSATTDLMAELRRAFPAGYPSVRAMTKNLEREYRPWRLGATLFTAFGALALIVAIVGIYSTVSYGVSQRMHEFGVRVALGARVHDMLTLVMGEGLRMVALGVVLGIALALAAGRLISKLLYAIGPSDPGVMLLVSAILLIVAAVATLLPAWRAARVDPVTALRAD
jgi:predicted permease